MRQQHEWIPVSEFGLVVQHAASKDAAGTITADEIVQLADTLRADTSSLVFKPGTETVDGFKIMTGHSGAVYLEGSPLTARQPGFHQALARAVRDAPSTAEGITDAVKGVAHEWIWDEEVVNPAQYHAQLRFGAPSSRQQTLSERAPLQHEIFERVMTNFGVQLDEAKARARRT